MKRSRLLSLFAGLALAASPVRASQDPLAPRAESSGSSNEDAARTWRGQRVVGRVVEIEGDQMTITLNGRPTRLTVPRDATARMDWSQGGGSVGARVAKRAGFGALMGVTFGVLAGIAMGGENESTCFSIYGCSAGQKAAAFAVIGGTVGLLIGAAAGLGGP